MDQVRGRCRGRWKQVEQTSRCHIIAALTLRVEEPPFKWNRHARYGSGQFGADN